MGVAETRRAAPEEPSAAPAGRRRRPRLLMVTTEDWYFLLHRLPMARAARDAGFEVVVAARVDRDAEAIAAEGFRLVPIGMHRASTNPLHAAADLAELIRVYRRERPDVIHHFALQPVVFGSLAAVAAGVPGWINTLAGLGYVFIGASLKARLLRPAMALALRRILGHRRSRLVVQNQDDRAMFAGRGLVPPERIALIRGSGVDCRRYAPMPEPDGVPVAVLAGRMLWDKGIGELVAAARILRRRRVAIRIALAGVPDPLNPRSIAPDLLDQWQREGLVEWRGQQQDMAAVWRGSHIAVLPSYREGLPKALLEAAACGRPLVATDVPGCRELVRHGVNGLLVPAREAEGLAEALATLAGDAALRARLGAEARRIVADEFSDELVGRQAVELYRLLCPSPGVSGHESSAG